MHDGGLASGSDCSYLCQDVCLLLLLVQRRYCQMFFFCRSITDFDWTSRPQCISAGLNTAPSSSNVIIAVDVSSAQTDNHKTRKLQRFKPKTIKKRDSEKPGLHWHNKQFKSISVKSEHATIILDLLLFECAFKIRAQVCVCRLRV